MRKKSNYHQDKIELIEAEEVLDAKIITKPTKYFEPREVYVLKSGHTRKKYSETQLHEILDDLEDWFNESPLNCFYSDWLFERGMYASFLAKLREKYKSFNERMEDMDILVEHRMIKLASEGILKEGMAKFILQSKRGYVPKSEVKNDTTLQIEQIQWIENKTYDK